MDRAQSRAGSLRGIGHIVCPWREHKVFLKEEEAKERLRDHNEHHSYDEGSPLATALHVVFESVGDEVSFYRGVLSGRQDALDRVKVRAGLDPKGNSPAAYVDRRGVAHLPFDEAVELAQKFCMAEPSAVLLKVEATEREWTQRAGRPGEEHMADLLNDFRAAWALIRQWAGHDAAVAAREAHIRELERLVWDAIYALQKAGLDSEAGRLRRALGRR